MRNGAFVFVTLLLGSCGSHTTSLDGARSQFLEAIEDYQACMNATSGEVIFAPQMSAYDPKRTSVQYDVNNVCGCSEILN